MRRASLLAAVFALGLTARLAHADDPYDTFGFKRAPVQQPLDCGSGRELGCATATDPFAEVSPYGLTTWLPIAYLRTLPVADSTHDDVADWVLGGSRDATGPAFAGATGLENRWSVEGAPTDGLRTGAPDAHVPLIFLSGMTVVTGGFTARDRTSTGATIDAELIKGGDKHVVDSYAWLGFSLPGDSLPPVPNDFNVRTGSFNASESLTLGLVASGPLGKHLGGTMWYAAGIAPTLGSSSYDVTSHRLVDANGDNIPDGFPGILVTDNTGTYSRRTYPYFVPAMARAGLDRGHHHFDVSLLGSVAHGERDIFNATLQASGVDQTNFVGDAIASYRGEWDDWRVHVVAGWHRNVHRESAHDPAAADTPVQLDVYVPTELPEDQAIADACSATRTDKFDPCPVPTAFFRTGGAGLLTDVTADRPSIRADVSHRIGNNMIRAGVIDEDTRYVQTTRFTGGSEVISLFPGHADVRRFYDTTKPCDPDQPATPCTYIDASELTYRTRYTAGYLEDTLSLGRGIVADGGFRYELMQVGNAFQLGEPAPRLGVAWDFIGDGTSRAFVSMGRSYPYLSAGIGAVVVARNPFVDDQTSPFGLARAVDGGGVLPISSHIEAPYQDEISAGVEYVLARVIHAKAYLQGRWMRRGFDTILGSFDNPGRTNPSTPTAERETELGGIEVALSPGPQITARVGWAYGRTVGTWTGVFDPRQGVVLYGGADYDHDFRNMFGPLPTDMGHAVYFEGQKTGHLLGYAVGIATRLTLRSGVPRDVLADSENGVIELLPRGSVGRTPMISVANARLFARIAGCDVQLELFDVFARQDATGVDTIYVGGEQNVTPIVGGSAEDLVWLKTGSGTVPTRHDGFGFPTGFQAPFAAVLGVHRSF